MDKLSIIGLESDKDKLLRDLMDQGTVELIDQSDRLQQEDWAAIVQKDGEEDRVSRVESQLSEVQTALDAIERYDTSKKPLFNTERRYRSQLTTRSCQAGNTFVPKSHAFWISIISGTISRAKRTASYPIRLH